MNKPVLVGIAVVVVIALAAVALTPSIITGPATRSTSTTSTLPGGASSQSTSVSYPAGVGTLNIYLADAPPTSPSLKYLLLNVSSVVLKYSGNVSTTAPRDTYVFNVPAAKGKNANLTSLTGNGILLGATTAPAGNITDIILNITGAKGFFTDGSSAQLKVVANGKLMVHFPFQVYAKGTTDLKLDLQPNDIHISAGQAEVLTPVIRVSSVERSQTTTTTRSTTTTPK